MTSRFSLSAAFLTSVLVWNSITLAYVDDDLLCRPGWSPELYYQQIWEQNNQERIRRMEYQYEMANAAAEQRSREIARLARLEKVARKREEAISKRKAQNALKTAPTSITGQLEKSASKPTP